MDKSAAIKTVNDYYDHEMFGTFQLQDKIGFFNVGYWKGVDDSIEIAQINLIETLIRFLRRRGSTVLDVACGKGASTKFLTKYFDPKKVTGINISPKQLSICRAIAPECQFQTMDATQLAFPDSTYDNILCIEAAFHFVTRDAFLEEAFRVLTSGGRLAMSDIVFDAAAAKISPALFPENSLPDLDTYRRRLLKIGFQYVRIEDSTQLSIEPLLEHMTWRIEEDFDSIGQSRMKALYEDIQKYREIRATCCMVYAIK